MSSKIPESIALAAVLAFFGACRHGTERLAPSESNKPRNAAPVDAHDAGRTSNTMENDASNPSDTRVHSADKLLRISGLTSQVRHNHGGPPAQLGTARFEIQNRSDNPRRVSVSNVTFVKAHPCGDDHSEATAQPKSPGIAVERPSSSEMTQPTVTIAPRESAVLDVSFAKVEAYQIFCDFFSFRVTFLVDKQESLTAIATTQVTRVTPLKP